MANVLNLAHFPWLLQVVGTGSGRLFLAGKDGGVHELAYAAPDGDLSSTAGGKIAVGTAVLNSLFVGAAG